MDGKAQQALDALPSKADLVGGKVVTSQLPAARSDDTFTVSTQAAMLALSADRGDVAIRADQSAAYRLGGDDPTVIGNWIPLPVPADAVQSVNGQQGIVNLGAQDVNARPAGDVPWGEVSSKPEAFPSEPHSHPNATSSAAGFMAAADKTKLDGLDGGGSSSGGFPIGARIGYDGTTDPPVVGGVEWMIRDGRAISRTTYSEYFALVGVRHGGGNGSSTFNIPDSRGRAMVSAGQGAGLTNRAAGSKFGAETHTRAREQLPSFKLKTPINEISNTSAAGAAPRLNSSPPGTSATHNAESENVGSGQSHENMQPSEAETMIVRVK